MKFEEVKEDYLKLIRNYGYPYDMTGGFVAEEHMEKVILNPTKTESKKYLIDVIEYAFSSGEYYRTDGLMNKEKIYVDEDDFIKEIYEKYIL